MADEADIATDYIDRAIALELHKRQQNSAIKKVGAKFCKDCGVDMPPERREFGCQLCKECAERTERRDALFPNN